MASFDRFPRPRLLPSAILGMGLLMGVKAFGIAEGVMWSAANAQQQSLNPRQPTPLASNAVRPVPQGGIPEATAEQGRAAAPQPRPLTPGSPPPAAPPQAMARLPASVPPQFGSLQVLPAPSYDLGPTFEEMRAPSVGFLISGALAQNAPSDNAQAIPAAAPQAAQQASQTDQISPAERALLENLRARRIEIDAREQAVAAREAVLAAAERRLQERIGELSALQQRLSEIEQATQQREEESWRGLVRTYEAMRPRDAATIFNDLEMPILAQVVHRMGERKAAPILAAMDPGKARALTGEVARLRGATISTSGAPPAALPSPSPSPR